VTEPGFPRRVESQGRDGRTGFRPNKRTVKNGKMIKVEKANIGATGGPSQVETVWAAFEKKHNIEELTSERYEAITANDSRGEKNIPKICMLYLAFSANNIFSLIEH
jgi:hypothetical protein